MSSIDPLRQSTGHRATSRKAQTADATMSETKASNSELNSVAQDVGVTMGRWQESLHQALTKWYEDAETIEGLISDFTNTAKSVVSELKGMIQAYQKYPNHVEFADDGYNRIVSAMTALGIPESQIQGGGVNSRGNHYFTGTQFAADIRMMLEYMQRDLSSFQGELSGHKQDQTKDLMAVMYCTNAVKMNRESLSGLLKTLTSITQSILQQLY